MRSSLFQNFLKSAVQELKESNIVNPTKSKKQYRKRFLSRIKSRDQLVEVSGWVSEDGAGRSGTGRSGAGRSGVRRSEAGKGGAGRSGAGKSRAGKSGAGRSGAEKSEAGRSGAGRNGAGRSEAGRSEAGKGGFFGGGGGCGVMLKFCYCSKL